MNPPRESQRLLAGAGLVAIALLISGVAPYERLTWLMEVAPVLVVAPILFFTYRRFPLTHLLYALIAMHCLVLILGGAYTYARVPLGFWMQDWFGFTRNHYDRIGHFAQGFVPAILAREILIRLRVVRGRGWLFTIVLSICLAFSAAYELLEWAVAVLSGSKGDSFLGTQGDIWDTQKDMALCALGAIVAQLLLARAHDRQLATVDAPAALGYLDHPATD